MISFIKNDKYISFINIIVILSFIIFNSFSYYYWFLIIELNVIIFSLIYMFYRFYLRSQMTYKEFDTIKKLYKYNFKYDNYIKEYEDEDTFNLEIKGYKFLLNTVIINVLRMDKKLDIESYDVLNKGLDILKKLSSKNDKIKEDYDLVYDVVNIIKKYYDKNCNRKTSILKYKKLLYTCIILCIIALLILVLYFIFKKIEVYSIVSSIYIVLLFVANLIMERIFK